MVSEGKKRRGKQKAGQRRSRRAPKAYVLKLYITGQSSLSSASVRNLLRCCREHLAGRYDVQVIDICQQPELARAAQIIATPTLVRTRPVPVRRFIGNLSDRQQMLAGLGIRDEARAK